MKQKLLEMIQVTVTWNAGVIGHMLHNKKVCRMYSIIQIYNT